MDFNVTASRKSPHVAGSSPSPGTVRLSLYQEPPVREVSLEEFESAALDRLQVLRSVEEAKGRGRRGDDLENHVLEQWRRHMRAQTPAETAAKDTLSHFVLRLAFCRTEELRRWFLAAESTLFRTRFRAEAPDGQRRFLESCKLPYQTIPSAELEEFRERLGQVARSMGQPPPAGDAAFYKVAFEDVPELVASRRVLLHKGSAFVPREQLSSLVGGHFRSRLSKALALTLRRWNAHVGTEETDRLAPIVESLSVRYMGRDYAHQDSRTRRSLDNIDGLAQESFPMCMRHLFLRLRDEHHLRHGGRMQLGLFLKGIGLSLEDALSFWRAEFSKKAGLDRFEKEYAYGIRHNFGKEGQRTDYTPYSCAKIIGSTPGVGDHHGCPFRHFSEENLRSALSGMGIAGNAVDGIVDKVRGHHYQLACGATFEAVHACTNDAGINHPNQYFDLSRKLLEAPTEGPSTPVPQGQRAAITPS